MLLWLQILLLMLLLQLLLLLGYTGRGVLHHVPKRFAQIGEPAGENSSPRLALRLFCCVGMLLETCESDLCFADVVHLEIQGQKVRDVAFSPLGTYKLGHTYRM